MSNATDTSVCAQAYATGTDKLKLIVIHTAKRPRDFGNTWQPNEHVDYFQSGKAWMNMKAMLVLKAI